MNGDLISRQAAIDTIESWLSCDDYNEAERHIMRAMQSVLYDLPPVQQKQRTGRWIESFNIGSWWECSWWECSQCGTHGGEDMKYCPTCGAKMQEVEE